MSTLRRALLIGIAFYAGSALGQSVDPELEKYLDMKQPRFKAYEPNYGIWQWTEDDEEALEAHYSFRYLFTGPDCTDENRSRKQDKKECMENYWNRWEWYLSYTGEFDFYMTTRDSSPVVNRISNPAVHSRWYFGLEDSEFIASLKYVDVAFQHLSNGQTFEADTMENGLLVTQTEYMNDPNGPFFDTISRSVNFVSVEASFRLGKTFREVDPITGRCKGKTGCFDLWVRLIPWYLDDDNPVTWGPDAGRNSIADYDRLRFILSNYREFKKQRNISGLTGWRWDVVWRIGDDLLKTDSLEISAYLPYQFGRLQWSLPFYIQFHHGPMNNLSEFTRKENSIGVGLRFF